MILTFAMHLVLSVNVWALSCISPPTRAGAMCGGDNCEIHFVLEHKINDGPCERLDSGINGVGDSSYGLVFDEFRKSGALKDLNGPYEIVFDPGCTSYAHHAGKVIPPIKEFPENCIRNTKFIRVEGDDLGALKRKWQLSIAYSWVRDPILLVLMIIGLELMVKVGLSRFTSFRRWIRFAVGFLSVVWAILWVLGFWYPSRWLLFPLALAFFYFRMRIKWSTQYRRH